MAKNIKREKSKKVSVAAFEKVMKEMKAPVRVIDWHGVELHIKRTLSLEEVIAFADAVTKSCFMEETNAYVPEVKVFAIKCCILELYAGFTLPANVMRRYELIYNTDAVDVVLQHIDTRQLDEIIDAISEKVGNKANENASALKKQMYDVYSVLNSLSGQVSKIFSDISPDDVSNLIGAISDNGIDEDKIVQAYIRNAKSGEEEVGEESGEQ